jgi:hypothetical protein
MQAIKGKTSHHLLSDHRRLWSEYWGRHLWARGDFVCSSGQVTDEANLGCEFDVAGVATDGRQAVAVAAVHSRLMRSCSTSAFVLISLIARAQEPSNDWRLGCERAPLLSSFGHRDDADDVRATCEG